MKNERTEGDVQYFVTCTYCGTQTGLSFKQLEGDKPLKCPTCGAPLKVVPPRAKGRGEPRTKIKREYGYLFTSQSSDDSAIDEETRKETSLLLVRLIMGIASFLVFLVLFIVALISTC